MRLLRREDEAHYIATFNPALVGRLLDLAQEKAKLRELLAAAREHVDPIYHRKLLAAIDAATKEHL